MRWTQHDNAAHHTYAEWHGSETPQLLCGPQVRAAFDKDGEGIGRHNMGGATRSLENSTGAGIRFTTPEPKTSPF